VSVLRRDELKEKARLLLEKAHRESGVIDVKTTPPCDDANLQPPDQLHQSADNAATTAAGTSAASAGMILYNMIYEKLKQTKTITNNWSDVFSCGFNVSHYY